MSVITEHPSDTAPDTPPNERAHTASDTAQRTRPRFTLSEAAQLTKTSRSTLRRRLDSDAFPHAAKDGDGFWRIPVEDLLAAGLTLSRTVPDTPHEPVPDTPRAREENEQLVQRLKDQLAELRAQIEVERAHRTAAEQIAAERAEHLDTARRALRMIEAAPRPSEPATPAPEPGRASPPQPDHLDPTMNLEPKDSAKPTPFSESPFANKGGLKMVQMPEERSQDWRDPEPEPPKRKSAWRRFWTGE